MSPGLKGIQVHFSEQSDAVPDAMPLEEGPDAPTAGAVSLPQIDAMDPIDPMGAMDAMDAGEREQRLLEHMPTVRYIARRIHERLPQHVEIEDLVSAGVLGLMDAFNKFDHGKNVQFRSYAQFRIRGAILDSLRTLDWSPRELRRKGRAIEEAIRAVTGRLGRAPLEAEIAQEMGMELAAYQQLLGELKGLEIGSLHVERSEDSGEDELAYVADSPEQSPLFQCLRGEMRDKLAEAIDELPEKERLVLTLYYFEEMTMKEIGLTLNVVESRISQIHTSAVLRLRTMLAALAGGGSIRAGGVSSSARSNVKDKTGERIAAKAAGLASGLAAVRTARLPRKGLGGAHKDPRLH